MPVASSLVRGTVIRFPAKSPRPAARTCNDRRPLKPEDSSELASCVPCINQEAVPLSNPPLRIRLLLPAGMTSTSSIKHSPAPSSITCRRLMGDPEP